MTHVGPSGRAGAPLIAGAAMALLAGCAGSPAPAPPPAPAPVSPTSAVTAAPPLTEPSPTVVIATEGPASWTMPNLVGSNLQQAQDDIQALTGFEIPVTYSHDETGAGREQLLDRNWTVCSQNIPAGAEITRNSRIDLGAVKVNERC